MDSKSGTDKTKLKIEKLNVMIGEKSILKNINITIKPELITCIVGKSGAGKSTLLRAIVRFVEYSGAIFLDNKPITVISVTNLRKRVCYVPQIPASFPGTVFENINWVRTYWKLENDSKTIKKLMDLVGLEPSLLKQSANTLSVGQLQKLSFARALAIEPDVLLLDEPASALDAISKENFEKIILTIKTFYKDLTIVLVTHDIQQARRVANDIILLDNGKIIIQADVNTFFKSLESQTDADFLKHVLLDGRENQNG